MVVMSSGRWSWRLASRETLVVARMRVVGVWLGRAGMHSGTGHHHWLSQRRPQFMKMLPSIQPSSQIEEHGHHIITLVDQATVGKTPLPRNSEQKMDQTLGNYIY